MRFVELSNYSLPPLEEGKGLHDFHFILADGDVYAINSDYPDDARLFLRALATLSAPDRGTYRFNDEVLDFSDYRLLLPYKRKIAYVSPDSAMISNRSIRDNLLLIRSYFENTASRELPEDMGELCRYFQLDGKLDQRPYQVSHEDVRLAIVVRELGKNPEILLLDRPRDFLGYRNFDLFTRILKDFVRDGTPIVFLSSDLSFVQEYAKKEVVITEGTLKTILLSSAARARALSDGNHQ